MKTKIIVILISVISISTAIAQDLTKDETINYLNKLLRSCNNAICIDNDLYYRKNTIIDNEIIALDDNKLIIQSGRCFYSTNDFPESYYTYQYSFPITKITEDCIRISKKTTGDFQGCIHVEIAFKEAIIRVQTVKTKNCELEKLGDTKYWDYFEFYIDGQEPENFNRFKKAILYLSELCKAEGNPFD